MPLVDEFVEDIWYDEPVASAPESAEEDHNAGATPGQPRRRGRNALGGAAAMSPAHFL